MLRNIYDNRIQTLLDTEWLKKRTSVLRLRWVNSKTKSYLYRKFKATQITTEALYTKWSESGLNSIADHN